MPSLPYRGKSGCALHCFTVTPSDTVPNEYDALYIGATGTVTIKDIAGNSTQFTAVPVGFFPVSTTFVMATGTSATTIVGLRIS